MTGITSLHKADRPGQAPEVVASANIQVHSAKEVRTKKLSRWVSAGVNAHKSKGTRVKNWRAFFHVPNKKTKIIHSHKPEPERTESTNFRIYTDSKIQVQSNALL